MFFCQIQARISGLPGEDLVWRFLSPADSVRFFFESSNSVRSVKKPVEVAAGLRTVTVMSVVSEKQINFVPHLHPVHTTNEHPSPLSVVNGILTSSCRPFEACKARRLIK